MKQTVTKLLISFSLLLPFVADAKGKTPDFENGKWVSNFTYQTGSYTYFDNSKSHLTLTIFVKTDPKTTGVWGQVTNARYTNPGHMSVFVDGTPLPASLDTRIVKTVKRLKGNVYYKGLLKLLTKTPSEWDKAVNRPLNCEHILMDYAGEESVSFHGHTQSLVSYDYSSVCDDSPSRELISPVMESIADLAKEIREDVLETGTEVSDVWSSGPY